MNQNAAGGNALVHIRAVPEGGPAGSIPLGVTNLPFTFYDRYTDGHASGFRNIDRRQPLPSGFVARWISGDKAMFDTQYKIWREGVTAPKPECDKYVNNSNMRVAEMVRFDERENAVSFGGHVIMPLPVGYPGLPAAVRVPVTSSTFPVNTSRDVGGWMFMNLDNQNTAGWGWNAGWAATQSVSRGAGAWNLAAGSVRPSQNWVVVSMAAHGEYGVDFGFWILDFGFWIGMLIQNPKSKI